MEFAQEIVEIPNVEELDKADIIALLDITEADYSQNITYLERVARRPNTLKEVVKAIQILKDKT